MLFQNRVVSSVFATSAGGAQAFIVGLGFRVIAPGPGQQNVVSVLSDAMANGRQVHVFINAAGQISTAQMI